MKWHTAWCLRRCSTQVCASTKRICNINQGWNVALSVHLLYITPYTVLRPSPVPCRSLQEFAVHLPLPLHKNLIISLAIEHLIELQQADLKPGQCNSQTGGYNLNTHQWLLSVCPLYLSNPFCHFTLIYLLVAARKYSACSQFQNLIEAGARPVTVNDFQLQRSGIQ